LIVKIRNNDLQNEDTLKQPEARERLLAFDMARPFEYLSFPGRGLKSTWSFHRRSTSLALLEKKIRASDIFRERFNFLLQIDLCWNK